MREVKVILAVLRVNEDQSVNVLTQKISGKDYISFSEVNNDESLSDTLARVLQSVGLDNEKGRVESVGCICEAGTDILFNYAAIITAADEYESMFPFEFQNYKDLKWGSEDHEYLVNGLLKFIAERKPAQELEVEEINESEQ